jgi:hypothetical protein
MPPGFTEDIFNQVDVLAGVVDDFEDGINVAPFEGINFRVELPKLTGGPLLWVSVRHFRHNKYFLGNYWKHAK